MRRTKIVCTLGPSCTDEATIRAMLLAGMNVARMNFSHQTHEQHDKNLKLFRAVRDSLGIPAAVMLDTKGPEIRVRDFESGSVSLSEGDVFCFINGEDESLGNQDGIPVTLRGFSSHIKTGDTILADDGKIVFEVTGVDAQKVTCRVVTGGELRSHKGLNVPSVHIDMPYLSAADKADLLFGVEHDVDFIAASFVRTRADVIEMRKFLDYHGGHQIKIIAKIENAEGTENFDSILDASDGIMIARGDMGVELEYERLPGLQKEFIRRCYRSGKMVITATQMLESMMTNSSPTRAEITDIANAVFDGTSAVMLSGETAAGAHPIEAVRVMAKVARQAERDAFRNGMYKNHDYETKANDITNAICDATCTTAADINARAIIAVTKNGKTARRMSKFRPEQIIVAATPEPKTFHQLSLSWGVCPVLARYQSTTDDLFRHALDCAKQIDVVEDGDFVVITGGVPLGVAGSTNILKVQKVGEN